MRREKWQGFFVLLLALGMIGGGAALVYCVWRNPNLASALGMLCAVGGTAFWASDALTLRFAPGRIVARRIDKAIQGKWNACLSRYGGSGQLLEEYRKKQQEDGEEGDGTFPCTVCVRAREGRRAVRLSGKGPALRELELREGDQVLLILTGLMQGVFLLGTLERLETGQEDCEIAVVLQKGLICDREQEVSL